MEIVFLRDNFPWKSKKKNQKDDFPLKKINITKN